MQRCVTVFNFYDFEYIPRNAENKAFAQQTVGFDAALQQ
jgi:hypothetical protein